eukprot:CAMPEP_0117764504 /NCGR_PEP_ID=MMETSP0947-20121206/19424_1 /TAXON_ID=44440 /ORGANISM="Chattonella subsalsa, Strain CCMP2191" /LENGTH=182 /DNA_ID=CAMNT_0005586717 /DNA_START=99 /DNA_END=647 /DNA_ORIENTATION=-
MAGRVCIVTGANTGIGQATALGLVKQGANVIMACRSIETAEKARKDIVIKTGRDSIEVMELDLSNFKSVRNFADNFGAKDMPLHILVNNAGVMRKEREIVEGVESTLAINHLGPSLLTSLLLPHMEETAKSSKLTGRVVNVTSRVLKRLYMQSLHLKLERAVDYIFQIAKRSNRVKIHMTKS